jgi:hypothetical protein
VPPEAPAGHLGLELHLDGVEGLQAGLGVFLEPLHEALSFARRSASRAAQQA